MSLTAIFAAGAAMFGAQYQSDAIQWRTYKEGTQSAATAQRIVVMETLGDYQKYVRDLQPAGAGDGRDIDWNKEELVAIHSGSRKTGGYTVNVQSISRVNPRGGQVNFIEKTPPKGSSNTQAITSPWVIVRITRFGGRLTFAGSTQEGGLPGGIKVLPIPGYGNGCGCCKACDSYLANQLPWNVFDAGQDSPVAVASNYIMSSQADWDRYTQNYQMKRLGDGRDINWYRERIVAIHSGRKMTGGFELLVDQVRVIDGRRVDLTVFELQPQSAMLTGLREATGPYLLVRIPRVGSVVTVTKKVLSAGLAIPFGFCDCGCASCKSCRR